MKEKERKKKLKSSEGKEERNNSKEGREKMEV